MDVAIDQGGNCEITEGGNVVKTYGITIDGTKNIPGMLPSTQHGCLPIIYIII